MLNFLFRTRSTPAQAPLGGGIGFAIFGGGANGSTSYSTTDKYTYVDNTRITGVALGLARENLAATGNDTVGIFGGGSNGSGNSVYTDKYTYAGNTRAAGTILGLARYGLAATSSSPGGF